MFCLFLSGRLRQVLLYALLSGGLYLHDADDVGNVDTLVVLLLVTAVEATLDVDTVVDERVDERDDGRDDALVVLLDETAADVVVTSN